MAQKDYYFTGPVRWAKVHTPDMKYGKHSVEIKIDEDKYTETGLQGRPSKDGEGYFTFRRDPKQLVWKNGVRAVAGKPDVLDPDGVPVTELIGNGSVCTLKVVVYDYDNSFGKGKGHRLEAVRVDELVKYTKDPESLSEHIGVRF